MRLFFSERTHSENCQRFLLQGLYLRHPFFYRAGSMLRQEAKGRCCSLGKVCLRFPEPVLRRRSSTGAGKFFLEGCTVLRFSDEVRLRCGQGLRQRAFFGEKAALRSSPLRRQSSPVLPGAPFRMQLLRLHRRELPDTLLQGCIAESDGSGQFEVLFCMWQLLLCSHAFLHRLKQDDCTQVRQTDCSR